MQTLLVATKNQNKAQELTTLLADQQVTVQTLLDYPEFVDVDETATTFEGNARLKAQAAVKAFQVPTLADDSGLMVDALYGQPGVRSARYAGDHNDAANNAKLLAELGGVPQKGRTAHFVATLVYQDPIYHQELVVKGQLDGLILTVPRGQDGFGYDPLFLVPELHKTLAELTPQEKNQVSHRGRALRQFVQKWQHLN
ncbi:XTP/dITP diphosphatase [Bombilactobacillus folatiphilus]|uniref:dITP/XTP pyrophosphatase n=1 Tax=Bombilactobacillus folatiphilus TaxID=2923362 RepID=A0ABY4P9P8_9LACO|nr:XTP/dITP diphosphatase [Bombilactobacillus folatiphilus]UQS82468.1 XTP/dITP diphosphatase [Bombilactobacillus folatiphilus]